MTFLTYDAIAHASRSELRAMKREIQAQQAAMGKLSRTELRYTSEEAAVTRCLLAMAEHDIEVRLDKRAAAGVRVRPDFRTRNIGRRAT